MLCTVDLDARIYLLLTENKKKLIYFDEEYDVSWNNYKNLFKNINQSSNQIYKYKNI